MNSKIALSVISILGALAIVGGATFAVFTSAASNNNNTFGAGNMQLRIDGNEGETSTPKFTISNAAPGVVYEQVITLSNTGTVAASSTKLTSIDHSTSTSPDLGDKLTLDVWDDVDGSGTINGGDVLRKSAHIVDASWSNIDLGFGLAASGGTHKIIAKVTFDSDAGDTYQGKNSTFDLNFLASQ